MRSDILQRAPAESGASILVWDHPDTPPDWHGPIVLWQHFRPVAHPRIFSLPSQLDKQPDKFRQRLLDFIGQLGSTSVGGRTLIDHLALWDGELCDGLSYWWMTLPAQKDVYASSPYLYDVLKLFVFEEWLATGDRAPITLVSSNAELAEVIGRWCQEDGRTFRHERRNGPRSAGPWRRRVFRKLSMQLRGRIAFAWFMLARAGKSAEPTSPPSGEIAVFDALTHFDREAAERGEFRSGYWSRLVALLDGAAAGVTWFHWFYEHARVKTARQASDLAARLTRGTGKPHLIIDRPLPAGSAGRVRQTLKRLRSVHRALRGTPNLFRPRGSRLDLAPLFAADWDNSFFGPKAVMSLFHVDIITRRMAQLPRQKLGLYIQENQPWEMVLNHAWKRLGHGLLVGVAHTTVPFWDLRYYFSLDTLALKRNGVPLPDLMALNGPDAFTKMREGGYPIEQCVEVEALRYLSLESILRLPPIARDSESRPVRLLIIGDLLPEYTNAQLALIEECLQLPDVRLEPVFRPHPAAAETHADLPYARSTGPLADALRACDAVFVGAATSAAADAYQIGVPVISLNGGRVINFSPLYRTPGVAFISSAGELAKALAAIDPGRLRVPGQFFTLDGEIPRWQQLVRDAVDVMATSPARDPNRVRASAE